LTRWAEARAVKDCSETIVARFIFDDIITRFGCPKILMSDQGTHLINKTIEALTEEFAFHHHKSTALPSTRKWDSGSIQQDPGDNVDENLQCEKG
jgi:hypothetical protein